VLAGAFLAPACAVSEAVHSPRDIRLIVSRAGGVEYRELSAEYGRAVPGIRFVPYDTTSSLEGLRAVQLGEADIGFIMADISYLAYAGRLAGQRERFDRLRAVFASGVLPIHLVVRPGARVDSVSDLAGYRVSVGPRGSAVERIALDILKAFRVPHSKLEQLPTMMALSGLQTGALDAFFAVGAFPGPAPAEPVRLALDRGARLVPIAGEGAERLREFNRYIEASAIRGGTYASQPDSVETVGVQNLLICRSDLDEDLVYELTKGFFQAIPASSPLVDAFRFMDLDEAAATSVPLHEGAARYYRERDLFQ
jgi:TRAP transporter TAXI family solute receptor